ncbi:uncharacterized protein EV420DRAFT_1487855 [Desarmillaria tabescens]|uniref:JmjC domain-containing protein n=1 Tax=Armillaria tabescens TaxID=1929756 RepID=A0AA39J5U8_ARMTA|nr:uncharacterized protein EV420DRAFT_1487855 [Desarmillaria tabescens]KAK0435806.1 hypothetical protein EV420DRAFT_1487855 [Desarmillaria tabescens]
MAYSQMITDYRGSVQQAAELKLFQSLPLHNRTCLLTHPLSACLDEEQDVPAQGPSAAIAVTTPASWTGFRTLIQDLACALPSYYRKGITRLPKAHGKAITHLQHAEAQKRVDLIEALITWRLVDELLRCRGIDDGEFKVDYSIQFKLTVKLVQVGEALRQTWVARLADWPVVLLQATTAQESMMATLKPPLLNSLTNRTTEQQQLWVDLQAIWSWNRKYANKLRSFTIQNEMNDIWEQVEASLNTSGPRSKDSMATLLNCATISLLILFKWSRDAAPLPVQCLMYSSLVDDRDKPPVLHNVECRFWSLLLAVSEGSVSAESGLILFLKSYRSEIQAATQPNRLRPWFEADVRLKPPKGGQGSSIETASETPQEEDKNAIAVAPIGEEEKPEVLSQRSSPTSVVAAIDFGDDTQEDPAAKNLATVAGLQPRRQKLTETLLPSHDEDGDVQLPEEKLKKKKSRRNWKKTKSKPMISEDESEASAVPVPRKIHELNSQSNPSESKGTYVHIHKPPRLRLTKAELAKHAEKVNDDEDVVWRTSYLEVNSTRGPVIGMDSPGKHPPPWVNRTDGSSQIAHVRYSSDLNIQPYFRERSVLVTRVPTDRHNWGWNACTAWELGDLDTEIPVHDLFYPSNGPPRGFKRTHWESAERAYPANARYHVAEPILSPDPIYSQAASHLEACKVTWSIGTDLLAAPFPAAALSWGLATVASAVTPPHTDYGGLAVKIHCLVGRKLWFIIRKRDEPSEAMSWDTFVRDFQADSKVDPNVYECEVIIVEPGSLWFQRPNTLHAVVMESNCLVFGQHFFSSSGIRSVVMGWIHMTFLCFAITNVEHRDMRVLLLRLMAYWKKVITDGEDVEDHDGHVPNITSRVGFLDICALGNLIIYLHVLSGQQDQYWNDLRFAVAQYWEIVSWANERLVLTGLNETEKVYEVHVAFKLSVLQFGIGLLDYHDSLKGSQLYKAVEPATSRSRQARLTAGGPSLLGTAVSSGFGKRRLTWLAEIPEEISILTYAEFAWQSAPESDLSSLSDLSGDDAGGPSQIGPSLILVSPRGKKALRKSRGYKSSPGSSKDSDKSKDEALGSSNSDESFTSKQSAARRRRCRASSLGSSNDMDQEDSEEDALRSDSDEDDGSRVLVTHGTDDMDSDQSDDDGLQGFSDEDGVSKDVLTHGMADMDEELDADDPDPDKATRVNDAEMASVEESWNSLSPVPILDATPEDIDWPTEDLSRSVPPKLGPQSVPGHQPPAIPSAPSPGAGSSLELMVDMVLDLPSSSSFPLPPLPLKRGLEHDDPMEALDFKRHKSDAVADIPDLKDLIESTSQSLTGLTGHPLPSDLVKNIVDAVDQLHSKGGSTPVLPDNQEVLDLSEQEPDMEIESEPESPKAVSQWRDEIKQALQAYLENHQPVHPLLTDVQGVTDPSDLYQVRDQDFPLHW